ncbi:hypothetical protein KKC97_02315 [bacterium]|nr:hypothetical protein [bacterium]MBU1636477.1 hypothetical protein [bacterium]MBU1921302.1 hypothetical protein [bacterium]
MNPDNSRLKLHMTPPPEMQSEIERGVMNSIEALPAPAAFRSQHRQRVIIGITAVAVSALILLSTQIPKNQLAINRDFSESRIFLSDHTSIWLTPVQAVNGD